MTQNKSSPSDTKTKDKCAYWTDDSWCCMSGGCGCAQVDADVRTNTPAENKQKALAAVLWLESNTPDHPAIKAMADSIRAALIPPTVDIERLEKGALNYLASARESTTTDDVWIKCIHSYKQGRDRYHEMAKHSMRHFVRMLFHKGLLPDTSEHVAQPDNVEALEIFSDFLNRMESFAWLALQNGNYNVADDMMQEWRDNIPKIRTALSQQTWRDIETSPKDGTTVLLLDIHGNQRIGGYELNSKNRKWGTGWEGRDWDFTIDFDAQLTHWMPLPPKPQGD